MGDLLPYTGLTVIPKATFSRKLFLEHLWFRKSQEGLKIISDVTRIFSGQPKPLHQIFGLHEKTTAMRVVTSAEELGTRSKKQPARDCLGNKVFFVGLTQ